MHNLRLTGEIAVVTGSTPAKCGMLTKYSSWHKARIWTGGLLIAAGIAAVSLALIYRPVKIEGNSMTPLLSDQEAIVINRLVYHLEPFNPRDVGASLFPFCARTC